MENVFRYMKRKPDSPRLSGRCGEGKTVAVSVTGAKPVGGKYAPIEEPAESNRNVSNHGGKNWCGRG